MLMRQHASPILYKYEKLSGANKLKKKGTRGAFPKTLSNAFPPFLTPLCHSLPFMCFRIIGQVVTFSGTRECLVLKKLAYLNIE